MSDGRKVNKSGDAGEREVPMTPSNEKTYVIETSGLGKRFGARWAVQDCTLRVPKGRVTALVGANGAGKTTLLRMLVGLASPSAGTVRVLGKTPSGSASFLSGIGYVAQAIPLYGRMDAGTLMAMGRHLNPTWDSNLARQRLSALHIPPNKRVQSLSGGQRAQVGLTLALAKQPQLLLLDEPVAALDPLARRAFLDSLSEAAWGGTTSVMLSSHLLHDLERVCDHIIVLRGSHLMLCEDIETLLATHRYLIGPRDGVHPTEAGVTVIKSSHTHRQTRLLVRIGAPLRDPRWEESEVDLEEIVLAYLEEEAPRGSTNDRHELGVPR